LLPEENCQRHFIVDQDKAATFYILLDKECELNSMMQVCAGSDIWDQVWIHMGDFFRMTAVGLRTIAWRRPAAATGGRRVLRPVWRQPAADDSPRCRPGTAMISRPQSQKDTP
jgi:hypothetical protein